MKTYTMSNLDIAKMQADLNQAKVIIMRLERENAELAKQQQCLAEIKAEAGRAGYELGAMQWCFNPLVMSVDIEYSASQYADKIRNAGTWLKDSNVNSGKRQGGAE